MIRAVTAAAVAAASLLTIAGLGCAAHSNASRAVQDRYSRCLAQYDADICTDLSTGAIGAAQP